MSNLETRPFSTASVPARSGTAGLLSRARIGLGIGCPLALLGLLLWHRSTIDAGADALGHADREWLMLAMTTAVGTWLAATCCQLGAITLQLPVTRVFAVQVAGSFTNHVLPAGLGVAAVNLRMLRRAGLSRPDAASAIGLNAAAGIIVHLGALIVVLTLIPRPHQFDPVTRIGLLLLATTVLTGLIVLAWRPPTRLARAPAALGAAVAHTRAVLRRPGRAVLLWAGSAAIPALHIATLLAVLASLGIPHPVTAVTLAYLGASAISALIPSPGGFGSLDVALVAALASLGTPTTHAIAAVIGYRLLTVWIPLLPGAATLAVLLHRHLI